MRNICYCISFFLFLSIKINAIEYYGYKYEFPYFTYIANQAIGGSLEEVDKELPEMFLISAKLNNYIEENINKGRMKNKPIVYDLCGFEYERKQFLYEIYEGENAYHISINNPNCEYYISHFSAKMLIAIIDYIISPEFKPIYTDNNIWGVIALDNSDKTNLLERDALLYSIDNLSVKCINQRIRATWDNKDIGVNLIPPVSAPFKFKDRYIMLDNDSFYVIDNSGKIIKKASMETGLNHSSHQSNIPSHRLLNDWVNFVDFDEESLYSYSYKDNRFFDLY